MKYHLAIDIGASSGRHVLGFVQNGKISTTEVYRFENTQVYKNNRLCWDMDTLFEHILEGMRQCKKNGTPPCTMAIDTWGVDFALLDENDDLLGDTVAYRDGRTTGMDKKTEEALPFNTLYAATGIQKQIFNTIYQLMAVKQNEGELLEKAQTLLMIPDYLNFLLTGQKKQEYTNATTTSLVNAKSKSWDMEIINKLGFPPHLFKPLSNPGEIVGSLSPDIEKKVGYSCRVLHAASHDTASAYMSVPKNTQNAATLSSGTWSLLGIESSIPVTSEKARNANFTNEGGYAGTYRILKNIMGLWMIQSIRRDYCKKYTYAELEQEAKNYSSFPARIDVNDSDFLAPRSMVEAIQNKCRQTGQIIPKTTGEVAACVYQSLSDCYADAIKELADITGKEIDALHIVGGGSKDGYLNSLTAQKTGLPVYAGPTEGTVIGNLAAQMIAEGVFANLEEARSAIRQSFDIEIY